METENRVKLFLWRVKAGGYRRDMERLEREGEGRKVKEGRENRAEELLPEDVVTRRISMK